MVLAGFKRLLRRNPDLAIELWPDYQSRFFFSHAELADFYAFVARNLAVNYRPDADYWLSQAIAMGTDDDLVGFGIRLALRNQDWQRTRIWLAHLHQSEHGSDNWRYWRAITEQSIGQHQSLLRPQARTAAWLPPLANQNTVTHVGFDLLGTHHQMIDCLTQKACLIDLLPESARKRLISSDTPSEILISLANERSFYGFLASERINKNVALNRQALIPDRSALEAIATHPGIIRARELHLLNEEVDAKREWHFAINRFDAEQRAYAAHLAHLWGWHHQAIVAAAQSTIHDHLELRFPVAFNDIVEANAKRTGLRSEWILSLIRQESAFAPDARSPAGALGMMQLMPSTARQVARQLGLPYRRHQLLDPDLNIQLGSQYLAQLYNQFDNNTVLATAAYNAGPHRARRWQPEHKPMPSDIWIETIPIRETRNYVKNVLTYKAIYRHHLGLDARLSGLPALIPARNVKP
jgi:soluble lytic murein transglycosylase